MIGIKLEKLYKLPHLLVGIFASLFILNLMTIIITQTTDHNLIYGLIPQFDFDMENNIPTYFSSVNLLICALLVFSIYQSHKKRNMFDSRYWFFLSILFLYLSIDESASIHEMLIRPMRDSFNLSSGWFFYPWVIPAIIICFILALFFLKFYLSLPSRYRFLFGLAAALFIGGAIGMEIIDGFVVAGTSGVNLTTRLLITLEETLEMAGVIIFIYALIDYMKSETQSRQ